MNCPIRRAVRTIQNDDCLPEYRFVLHQDDRVVFYVRDPKRLARGIARPIKDEDGR